MKDFPRFCYCGFPCCTHHDKPEPVGEVRFLSSGKPRLLSAEEIDVLFNGGGITHCPFEPKENPTLASEREQRLFDQGKGLRHDFCKHYARPGESFTEATKRIDKALFAKKITSKIKPAAHAFVLNMKQFAESMKKVKEVMAKMPKPKSK